MIPGRLFQSRKRTVGLFFVLFMPLIIWLLLGSITNHAKLLISQTHSTRADPHGPTMDPISETSTGAVNNSVTQTLRQPPVTGPTKILLVTFYRGGSSVLGESFNRNDDAFYFFEPLTRVFFKSNIHEAHVTRNENKVPEYVTAEAVSVMSDLLNCRLSMDILARGFMAKSEKLKSFPICLRGWNKGTGDAEMCLKHWKDLCLQSKIRVAKTIRLELYMIPLLWKLDPDIKVIYYVRDPRGMILSRSLSGRPPTNVNRTERVAKGLCSRMLSDITWYNRLKDMSPKGFIRLMRYEDLALDSMEFLREEYDHLGLTLPDYVEDWFYRNTHAEKPNGVMGTTRTNSSQTAQRWQQELSVQIITAINRQCSEVLKHLEYNQ